jgi:hypothetical protein
LYVAAPDLARRRGPPQEPVMQKTAPWITALLAVGALLYLRSGNSR